jgi:hypothetical protein
MGYLSTARTSLDVLPANPAVTAMGSTCDLLLARLEPTG